jgi:hypothetical protein
MVCWSPSLRKSAMAALRPHKLTRIGVPSAVLIEDVRERAGRAAT